MRSNNFKAIIMKWSIFVLCIIISTSVYSQSDKAPKKLQKKWRLYQYEMYDIRYRPSYRQRKDMINIQKDTTYIRLNDGAKTQGTWSYSKDEKELYLKKANSDKAATISIKKLTCRKFIYTTSEDNHVAVNTFLKEKYYERLTKKSKRKQNKKAAKSKN